jgi:trehalose/maltose hydrolase-like predicted phosphorylase
MSGRLRGRSTLFVALIAICAAAGSNLAAQTPSGSPADGQAHARSDAAIGERANVAEANPWLLFNTSYAPTDFTDEPFVGNGYLGLRIPAIGAGYQGGNLGKSGFPLFSPRYTSALVAGVYGIAKASPDGASGNSSVSDYISSLPTWSEMDLTVDGQTLNSGVATSQISRYRQSVNMRNAIVTTAFRWTPSPGKSVDVTYEVLANRAHMHLGEVRLTVKPSWTGELVLNGLLNGQGAVRANATSRKVDTATDIATVMLRTPGRNTRVAETQLLVAGDGTQVMHRSAFTPGKGDATAGERWTIEVSAGKTYQVIKYVGISTSNDPGVPAEVAAATVRSASAAGWPALLNEHRIGWEKLWANHVQTPQKDRLQVSVNSAFYLLYSSIRSGLAWSIPPAGLTSDNYGGEIFWDADTWMFPTLLAFHPDLAKSIVDFRYDTKSVAEANAAHAGYKGGTWAWDNGPSATCGGLAPCSHYEDHLQSDIALAQWQYYEATGDTQWLAERGYPVIKDVADFWVSRLTLGHDGKYHDLGVTGPDEFTAGVNDESATNAGAVIALRDAVAAAKAIGKSPDPRWTKVSDDIYIAVDPDGTHPEYAGYANQTVKQADTVLMTYPLGYVSDHAVAMADLDRYVPVTDPGGPAMTASVEGVIAAQVQQPGCVDFTLLQDSYLPFLRGAYDQFLETQYLTPSATQGPPTFDFATGAGGFLQMFPYGFAGLRWSASALMLNPTLPPQLSEGITIRGLHYQGRLVTIAIGARVTTVTLTSGEPLAISSPSGALTLRRGEVVQLKTARPDLDPTENLARCHPVSASSASAADQPAAAVDGNDVTEWMATATTSSYEVDLGDRSEAHAGPVETARAVVRWGKTRPARYSVSVLTEAGGWSQVGSGSVASTGDLNAEWKAVKAKAVRFTFSGGSAASIREIDVPAVSGHASRGGAVRSTSKP